MKKFLFLIIVFVTAHVGAQDLIRTYNLPVIQEGQALPNAWAGGLNSPQFSHLDVDIDGVLDLIAFDRAGDRMMVFINEGSDGYIYTREYNNAFPSGMINWVVARDFNCDGKMDLATNSQSGFIIYKNISTEESGLNFDLMLTSNINNLQMSEYAFSANPFSAPVYTISIDMPSFVDYDDDGDIDVFSFTEFSTTVYFFKNMSVENGNCEVPQYICANRCYGHFSESVESFSIFFGSDAECQFNVVDPRSSSDRLHTGATILQIDMDQNGIKDMILSDVTEPNMGLFLMEDAIDGQDSVVTAAFDFPNNYGNNIPVGLDVFPAGYYLDVDNDGIKDLIVSPNAATEVEDKNSVWYYKNNGQNDLPQLQFMQNDFLQNTMIDLGSEAYPAIVDLDSDGLLDIVVSNRKTYSSTETYTSTLAFYKNIGTATYPTFELMEENYLNIPTLELRSVYPHFNDWDDDGDLDLILGDQDGFIRIFKNEAATPGLPIFATPELVLNSGGQAIDVGQFSTPQYFDLDNDGLKDLIVGEKNGNINLYRNVGVTGLPAFEFIEDTIGDVVASNYLGIDGYSVPYFYRNTSNLLELLVASETGKIGHYDQIEENILGTFNQITDEFQGIREGDRCAIAMSDITGDGINDMLYGHIGGGLALYLSEIFVENVGEVTSSAFKIFPNPTQTGQELRVELSATPSSMISVEIFDSVGRLNYRDTINTQSFTIKTPLDRGVYFIKIGDRVEKWIVR